MEVSSALYDIFSCPSCYNIMAPPIYMCDLGHSFCGSCYHNIDKCPTCRASISARRNTAVEAIQSSFVFPCTNTSDGCKVSGSAVYVREHEEYCSFSLTHCELKLNNCKWTGIRDNMVKHCMEQHSANVLIGSKHTLVWPKLDCESSCRILINAFGKQFICVWSFEDDGFINLSITYIGLTFEADRYYYSIEFGTGDGPEHTRLIKRRCHYAKSCRNPKHETHVFLKLRKIIKDYSKRGQFYYTVTIYDFNVSYPQMVEDRRNNAPNLETAVCPKWKRAQPHVLEPLVFFSDQLGG